MVSIIKVDKNDKFIDLVDKLKAHQGKGILHRAFSVFVVNDKGEILIQQRSKDKLLWPLYWSNTCCSHPVLSRHPERSEGSITTQAEKRLGEEMGFTVSLKPIFKFQYQAKYKNIGIEQEIDTVLLGKYSGQKINPDPKEIADYQWIKYKDLIKQIKNKPGKFTPWIKKSLEGLRNGS